jgi:hypothetical protein
MLIRPRETCAGFERQCLEKRLCPTFREAFQQPSKRRNKLRGRLLWFLGAIGLRALDDLPSDGSANHLAHYDITAKVQPGPDARFAGLID